MKPIKKSQTTHRLSGLLLLDSNIPSSSYPLKYTYKSPTDEIGVDILFPHFSLLNIRSYMFIIFYRSS